MISSPDKIVHSFCLKRQMFLSHSADHHAFFVTQVKHAVTELIVLNCLEHEMKRNCKTLSGFHKDQYQVIE
jgi:hypothetical protein